MGLLVLTSGGRVAALDLRVLVASAPTLRVSTQAGQGLKQGWQVGVQGGHLTLDGRDTGSAALYLPPAPDSRVELAGKSYRGGVALRVEGRDVHAINVVGVEDYLRGVVAAEMPASWPAAALAAQAVIARTYASAHVRPDRPYDTCATEQCQVYRGVSAEHPATDAAIRATAGQVLTYAGQAAQTYFSSDSGGYVASSQEVWQTDVPYLVAKPDPYSSAAAGPRASWTLRVPLTRVREVAAGYGVRVGALSGVRVRRSSSSGRVQELVLSGVAGDAVLGGAEAGGLVRALGARSSRVTLDVQGGALVISGAGSGHGVGLSQYGALGMARAGYDHLDMLGFYYPGTSLGRLAAAQRPGRAALARFAFLRPLTAGQGAE